MQFALACEMQRPTLDDHAVIEETIEQFVLADGMGFGVVIRGNKAGAGTLVWGDGAKV